MVLMPPGAAKSTYASVLFPTWWLQARPEGSVIAAAHTGELARHFGAPRARLVGAARGAPGIWDFTPGESGSAFATTTGGSYYAVGVRGPVTGRRADLLLIDDPVRSAADASGHVCAAIFGSVWVGLATRLRPEGAIVLVMTRWHHDDLAGRLIEAGDAWRVLRLPALAEADDPLGRAPGVALWPEWEDEAALTRKRRMVGNGPGRHCFSSGLPLGQAECSRRDAYRCWRRLHPLSTPCGPGIWRPGQRIGVIRTGRLG